MSCCHSAASISIISGVIFLPNVNVTSDFLHWLWVNNAVRNKHKFLFLHLFRSAAFSSHTDDRKELRCTYFRSFHISQLIWHETAWCIAFIFLFFTSVTLVGLACCVQLCLFSWHGHYWLNHRYSTQARQCSLGTGACRENTDLQRAEISFSVPVF